jgi:hypothetical protein
MGAGCIWGAFALAMLGAVAGAGVGIWAAFDPTGNPVSDLFGIGSDIDTRELPGDARAFDPFAAFPAVQDYAGEGVQLIEIDVSLVRADGTLDLEAPYTPKPDVTYTFAREVPRPSDAAPPGAGGANTGPWYEEIEVRAYDPGQRRQVTRTTGNRRETFRYTNKGMERTVAAPVAGERAFVPAPACSIAAMFAAALERGAPADAVARVTYDAEGYRFTISGFAIALQFDHSCALVE